jgi:hypothetical protein
MSESLNAVRRRLEAARSARERIDAARQARDAAEQALRQAESELYAKLRQRNAAFDPLLLHCLDDTKQNRTTIEPQLRNAGQTVIFTSDPDYKPFRLVELAYRSQQNEFEAALRDRLPKGWEGDNDAPDFISLADVEPWLTALRDQILALKDFAPSRDAAVSLTAHDISNFYRILDHLSIDDRPPNFPMPVKPANANDAEFTVMELRRWVCQRLEGPQTLADLRVRLKAAAEYAAQITELPSMDGVEEAGDLAAHVFESRIRQCEHRVGRRLADFLGHEFMPLADRIVQALGYEKFPKNRDPPTELPDRTPGYDLAAGLFGLDYSDLPLAGKLLLVWSAWAHRNGKYRPLDWYERRYLPWALNALVSRRSGEPTAPCVLGQPFNWAITAFDELAAPIAIEREPLLTPEVRAALEPLRALNELERERERKQAEIFLLAQGWRPDLISSYLTSRPNVQKVLDAEQVNRSMIAPPATEPLDQQPPATGASEQGEGDALPPSRQKAYGQYLDAVRQNPELANATDRAVYDAVKERLDAGESLPTLETWSKYLRAARTYHAANKYQPRAGRERGKSIVTRDQI